ncbi:serine/threonine protein kinase [Vibrio vulnificus]|nr:serine/threonine protein kinase [Vibrio vulnificus]EIC2760264.1 serine/threonine protein kinase [Vibrio vulnificus]
MQLGSSATQVFYHLLDLNEEEKQQALQQLEQDAPDVYRALTPLIQPHEHEPFTALLGFHANHATEIPLDLSNQLIDKYQLTHELGRGGMGVVYAAYRADETFEQQLAIKFIQPSLTQVLGKKALFDEAQLLARLNHPCIAKVFDGGVHQDSVYIVMEKVEGVTLDAFLQQHHLDTRAKLTLFRYLCQAIEHAHHNQVLHADIKPENILIDQDIRPKLLDFNLTQKVSTQANQSGQVGLVAFSEHYASPEQKSGGYLTQQSDLYSLGKILHLLFPQVGKHSDLRFILDKATQAKAEQRYQSVSELRADIENMLACRPISLKQHIPLYTTKRLIQRRPVPSLLLTLLVMSGMLFTSTLMTKNRQLQQEKLIAENMMYEVTSLMFHTKGNEMANLSVNSMLEITRRRILSNPDIPKHIKQKMLLAMITPTPEKHAVEANCQENCRQPESKW